MKKFLAALLALSLVFCLVACATDPATTGTTPSAKPSVPTTQKNPTQQPTTAPTEPTTAPTEPTTAPTEPTTAPTEPAPTEPAPTEPAPTEPKPTEPPHTHTVGDITADLHNHYQLCAECGEVVTSDAHTLDDFGTCTECLTEFCFDEGVTELYRYDEYGSVIFNQIYDSTNTLVVTYSMAYTYDDAGNVLTETVYLDGILSGEVEYAIDKDGYSYIAKETLYYEDGSKDYHEYDEWYNNTLWISFNSDGNILFVIRNEYTCDDQGNVLYQKTYEDDILVSESEYTLAEGEYGSYTYCSKEITYYDDGSMLITEYNDIYEVISEVYLDANGNPVDNSGKFDAEICAPLFGTWEGKFTLTEEMLGMFGMEGVEDVALKVTFTFIFNEDGTLLRTMEIDPDSLVAFMVEFMYITYEGFGMTRDEIDATFQQEMGMSLEEYVIQNIASGELDYMLTQTTEEVYYVEDDRIYAGTSWTSRMEPQEFELDGKILTIFLTGEDQLVPYELKLNRMDAAEDAVLLPVVTGDGITSDTINPLATGKITILNFWGTWCGPCIKELPHFDQFARDYADSVTVIAIHTDNSSEKLAAFIQENYADSPIIFSLDDAEYSYYLSWGGMGVFPYTVILDEYGNVLAVYHHSITYADLEYVIKQAL